MTQDQEIKFPKKISVDVAVIKILSESTYDSFPYSLKELIVNSYDADSKNVFLTIDLKKEIIIIEDDGSGISPSDFDFYLTIAGKKRDKGKYTKSGRPIIGQFGVGFLSVFPFFLNYSIETKKAASPFVLVADIPCFKYFNQQGGKVVDIGDIKVSGTIKHDRNEYDKSYTKITLSGFTSLAKTFFNPTSNFKVGKKSILSELPLTKLKWFLEDDLPLKYEDKNFNNRFKEEYKGFPFSVYFNGKELSRKVFGKTMMKYTEGVEESGNIRYRYFICENGGPLQYSEETGLKIRNLNVGVGKRTTFDLGIESARARLSWISGEVHILDGLNNEIRVSRDDFKFNADYNNLRKTLVSLISNVVATLGVESDVGKFITTDSIKDLKYLEKASFTKKLDKVKQQKLIQPKVTSFEKNTNSIPLKDNSDFSDNIGNIDLDSFEKKYKIKGKQFTVIADKWDIENSDFPACKLSGNQLILNNKYPLFKKRKHLDIFIRFNVLLLMWLNEKKITKSEFKNMSNDILTEFFDNQF
jgi:hypothetical protein